MKGLRTLKRYFRDAAKSVIRNFPLSLASISCITITLIVVAVSIIISYNVENFAESIRKDVTIVVFLDNDTTESQVDEIEKKLKKMDNIDKIEFKTKQEAAEEAKTPSESAASRRWKWSQRTTKHGHAAHRRHRPEQAAQTRVEFPVEKGGRRQYKQQRAGYKHTQKRGHLRYVR